MHTVQIKKWGSLVFIGLFLLASALGLRAIADELASPTITLIKVLDRQYGATEAENDFGISINGDVLFSGDTQAVVADTPYTISEDEVGGWEFVSITGDAKCPSALGGAVTLNAGEDITCTITNRDLPNTISGYVYEDVDGNAEWDEGEPAMSGWEVVLGGEGSDTAVTNAEGYYTFTGVPHGYFEVLLTTQDGWAISVQRNEGISFSNGEVMENVNFGMVRAAKLTIVKESTPNDLKDFYFVTSGTGLEDFLLDDDQGVQQGDDTLQNSRQFNLIPGAYTITEAPNDFWVLDETTCTHDGDKSTFSGMSEVGEGVLLTLGSGEEVTCVFSNAKINRTKGQSFWQNHSTYTQTIFTDKMGGALRIGSQTVNKTPDSFAEFIGAFWASSAKTTLQGKAGKRSDLDKARMQLVPDLITAELNCAAFGCDTEIRSMVTRAHTAYAGTNPSAILAAGHELSKFNNSGDSEITTSVGSPNPTASKNAADIPYWNTTVGN